MNLLRVAVAALVTVFVTTSEAQVKEPLKLVRSIPLPDLRFKSLRLGRQ